MITMLKEYHHSLLKNIEKLTVTPQADKLNPLLANPYEYTLILKEQLQRLWYTV